MDCEEEILGDTNAKEECQPLLWQPQEDTSTTKRRGRKRNEGEGSRKSEVWEWWRIALNQSRR